MTKLSATDANFIYAENDACPMSIASLQYMELPENMSVDTFVSTLKTFIKARAQWVPYLTNKLQFSSGLFDHPNWIRDTQFDINNHIYTFPVPQPGTIRQVEQSVARLHETPLNRDRPLWDIVVLTGLANGQIAYYNRVHHACLDGMAAQAAYDLLMDKHPSQPEEKSPIPPTCSKPLTLPDHLIGMFESLAQQSIDLATQWPARSSAARQVWQQGFDPTKGISSSLAPCPTTPFNKTIDRGRVFAIGELPLNDLKEISKRMKCTINDVFLALCGGALREYLKRHNALPDSSLIAGCPVSLRKPGDAANNNQVAMMRVALATDVDEPVARLIQVRSAAREAKHLLNTGAALIPSNITAPSLGLAVRGLMSASALLGLADRAPPPINVLISNVPGPRQPLYSNGARMLTHYPVSIPTHGVGINITVQSYVNTLYIGITAAAKVAPDADLLRDDLYSAYQELCAALSAKVVELPRSQHHIGGDKLSNFPANAPQEGAISDQVA